MQVTHLIDQQNLRGFLPCFTGWSEVSASLTTSGRDYWFQPASLFNLAVVRIIIVTYQLFYLTRTNRGFFYERFQALAELPDSLYRPLPILRLFIWPLGWENGWYRPSYEVLLVIYGLTMIAGAKKILYYARSAKREAKLA